MIFKTLEKYSPKRLGFLQALGVTLYCSLIGLFFWKGNEVFGKPNQYFGPVMFLLLFSFSVLFCALVVFYRPYVLFFDGKKKAALDIVAYTSLWLFGFFLVFLLMVLLVR